MKFAARVCPPDSGLDSDNRPHHREARRAGEAHGHLGRDKRPGQAQSGRSASSAATGSRSPRRWAGTVGTASPERSQPTRSRRAAAAHGQERPRSTTAGPTSTSTTAGRAIATPQDPTLQGPPATRTACILPNARFPDMKALCRLHPRPGPEDRALFLARPVDLRRVRGQLAARAAGRRDATRTGASTTSSTTGAATAASRMGWPRQTQAFRRSAGARASSDRRSPRRPYRVMGDISARADARDIVYSLCQYGMGNVWEWGAAVGGNCWRTTGDITDTWGSMSRHRLRPGRPRAVRRARATGTIPTCSSSAIVGWGPSLHPTRLTPNEQYTHISLWCLLCSPLLIGCDLTQARRLHAEPADQRRGPRRQPGPAGQAGHVRRYGRRPARLRTRTGGRQPRRRFLQPRPPAGGAFVRQPGPPWAFGPPAGPRSLAPAGSRNRRDRPRAIAARDSHPRRRSAEVRPCPLRPVDCPRFVGASLRRGNFLLT